jgi:ATP phosphoribosyltransferase regulatory subunit
VSFEMGLISAHEYYTGVIFSGYTYGSGEPIVKGGRYDQLLSYFVKDAYAIGFAVFVDGLLMAVDNQKISLPMEHKVDVILYQKEHRISAIEKAKIYRDYGKIVQMIRYADSEELKRYKEMYQGDFIEVIGEE